MMYAGFLLPAIKSYANIINIQIMNALCCGIYLVNVLAVDATNPRIPEKYTRVNYLGGKAQRQGLNLSVQYKSSLAF